MVAETLMITRPGQVTYWNRTKHAHWTEHRAETAAVREFFGWAARQQIDECRVLPPWDLVTVEFLLRVRPGRRLPDVDAIAPAAKAAVDGLVDAGVMPDDSPRHLRAMTFHAPEPSNIDALVCFVRRNMH